MHQNTVKGRGKKKCDGRCHFVVVPFGTRSWPSCPLEGQKRTQDPSGLCSFIRSHTITTPYCAYLRNFLSSSRIFAKVVFRSFASTRKRHTRPIFQLLMASNINCHLVKDHSCQINGCTKAARS